MIQSPIGVLGENAKVEDLVDNSSRSWKTDLVDEIFFEHEAKIIKGIPLSPIVAEDKMI